MQSKEWSSLGCHVWPAPQAWRFLDSADSVAVRCTKGNPANKVYEQAGDHFFVGSFASCCAGWLVSNWEPEESCAYTLKLKHGQEGYWMC